MKHLILKRIQTGEYGTFGVLMEKDHPPFALTLEPPDKNNEPNISCIPRGAYHSYPVSSPRFGKTWEVIDVPGRSHILFHGGNTAASGKSDTLGCIMVAKHYWKFDGIPGIQNRDGFLEFLKLVKGQSELTLTIKDYFYI